MATRSRRRGAARLSHIDARGQVRMVDVSGEGRDGARGRRGSRRADERCRAPGDPPAAASRRAIRFRRRDWRASWPRSAPRRSFRCVIRCPCRTPTWSWCRGGAATRFARARRRSGGPVWKWKRSWRPSVAALTLYDMLKAVDRAMMIGPVRLIEKRGGRSGHYRRR